MKAFLSFGDARFEPALGRIGREAAESGLFDRVGIRRPRDLGGTFWRRHGRFVRANRRGYGCWIWKPWLIVRELASLEDGGILVYADSGCTIAGGGRSRFDDYCRMLTDSAIGVLAFRLPFEEKLFTKGDAFQALHGWRLKDTPQVMATIILWRKSAASLSFAHEWLGDCENYQLLSDAPSIIPNDAAFVTHRHDQSLFSLGAKLRGATVLDDETMPGAGAPFQTSRLKARTGGAFRGLRRDLAVDWQRLRSAVEPNHG